MANNIEFKVLGDVKDLESSMSKAKKSFDTLGKTSAVAFAGMTASSFLFINSAREHEAAVNMLNNALKNQGNYTEAASKELQDYAEEIQKLTLFDNTAVVGAERLIAAFGFEGDQLKELTKATVDLAQAKGMDLSAAADLVSKSVGSSTNALTRYGVVVEGAVGSSERVNSALKNMNNLFGGQAQAAAGGLGATVRLNNAFDDMYKEIGFALAPSVIKLSESLTRLVDSSSEFIRNNPKLIESFTGTALVITGGIAGAWALSAAYNSISVAVTGLIPLLTTLAPLLAYGTLALKVVETVKATWDLVSAQNAYNEGIREQQRVEEESLAARGLTRDQVMSDATMRIEILKTVTAAEEQALQQKIDNEKNANDQIEAMKTEMQAISAARTQQEIDELLLKYQYQMEADIEYLNMKQQLLADNLALTDEQQTAFDDQRAEARAKYDALEFQGKQAQQNKLSALDQKGLEIAKKVNADKVTSLATTLQQAAGLNSKFANAYKAVAIGEAIMSTASGIARAFKDYPFPASVGVAAIVGAMGAIQIATIAGQSFAVGTPEIPRDMTATVHQGEMIVPATFSDAIRSGDLSLSGGGSSNGGNGNVFDFTGATFNGITEEFVQEIFTRASESISNRTLIFRGA